MPYYFTTVTLTSSADSVCPGDTVVFTCVTDTAPLVWSTSVNEHVKVYYSSDQVNKPAVNLGGIFIVKLVNTTGQFESTATAHNVSSDYNGVNIICGNTVNCLSCTKTRSITVGKKLFIMYIIFLVYNTNYCCTINPLSATEPFHHCM